jgi:phosphoribosylaminoimidazole-succinocarboxamide synthase
VGTGARQLLVTTDRVSAFDRVLASVPFKGQVLNLISLWWFDRTKHIVRNRTAAFDPIPSFAVPAAVDSLGADADVLSSPHPNATLARKAQVFPVEFVVRGYARKCRYHARYHTSC